MKTKQIIDLMEIDENSLDMEYINILISNENEFKNAKSRYKNNFYTLLIRSITHETFEESKAKKLFEEILIHLKDLNNKLNRDVGIVVAAIDYLHNIKNIISEPKIIEEDKSEFITEISTRDELTSLYIRDVFDIFLDKSLSDAKRKNEKLSLLMIDVDDFKKVNDSYGHQKGDEVLSSIGEILNKSIRDIDFAARYGGEELTIIMPNTTISNATQIANRIREEISTIDFDGFSVTVSIGISEINQSIDNAKKLIKSADEALYKAKNSGKNNVKVWHDFN